MSIFETIADKAVEAAAGVVLQEIARRALRRLLSRNAIIVDEELEFTTHDGHEYPPEFALRTFEPREQIRFKGSDIITCVFTSQIYEDSVDRIRIDHDGRSRLWEAELFEPLGDMTGVPFLNFEACPVCAVKHGTWHDEQPHVEPGPIYCNACGNLHSVWPVYR